jgi:hypothetical protein
MAWFAVAAALVASFPARPTWLTALAGHAVFFALYVGVRTLAVRSRTAVIEALALIAIFWCVIFICAFLVRMRYH